MSPRLHAVTCAHPSGLHRMAYYEWGDPNNQEIVFCVHGLTRTGRDFDVIAEQLSANYRVVCPDVVGRGLSDWLPQPALYGMPQYLSDMVTLITALQPKRLHWLGTSMGGLIGLLYGGALVQARLSHTSQTPAQTHTALPHTQLRLDSIILNDVGPHIEPVSLARIGKYVGEDIRFTRFNQAVDYVRLTCESFGLHSTQQWENLTRFVYIEQAGEWIKHYDLTLSYPFKQLTPESATLGEAFLWSAFSSLTIPIGIIRGQESDLLSEQTCLKMLQHQPLARLTQLSAVGHAPTLMQPGQISVVEEFLSSVRAQENLAERSD